VRSFGILGLPVLAMLSSVIPNSQRTDICGSDLFRDKYSDIDIFPGQICSIKTIANSVKMYYMY
jgi:hypothetical protein